MKKGFYPINIQLFAEGGSDSGEQGADNSQNDSAASDSNGEKQAQKGSEKQNKGKSGQLSPEVEKLLQSATDRVRNEYGKRVKALEDALEASKKDGMTAAELAEYEKTQREKDLADRESKILDRENKYFALTEITGLNYSVSAEQSEALVSLVMAPDQKTIKANVEALKSLVDSLVQTEVEKTFKSHGTTPKGGKNNQNDDDGKTSFAASLGKAAASRNKQTQSVINQYLGKKG